MYKYFVILIFTLALVSCDESAKKEIKLYEGPLREVENVELFYSEHDRVTIKMKARLIYEYQNGDREFPKGIYMEFYDEVGNISSTLRANNAYYFVKEHKWRGQGNVEVKNIAQGEQLNTEELFWKPTDETISSEKFVTVRTRDEVLWGTGLDAKQDLSDYHIRDISGILDMEEMEEEGE